MHTRGSRRANESRRALVLACTNLWEDGAGKKVSAPAPAPPPAKLGRARAGPRHRELQPHQILARVRRDKVATGNPVTDGPQPRHSQAGTLVSGTTTGEAKI